MTNKSKKELLGSRSITEETIRSLPPESSWEDILIALSVKKEELAEDDRVLKEIVARSGSGLFSFVAIFLVVIIAGHRFYHQFVEFWQTKPDWPFIHLTSMLIQFVLLGAVLFAWMLSFYNWFHTIRCLGFSALSSAYQSLKYKFCVDLPQGVSPSLVIVRDTLKVFAWSIPFGVIAYWLKSEFALILAITFLSWAILMVIDGARVPCILLLGSSGNLGFRLQVLVSAILQPYETSVLLDREIGSQSIFGKFLHTAKSFRTVDESSWKDIVQFLMMTTVLIIIDARQTTAALQEELEWIQSNNYADKAVFVVWRDGRCPLLTDVPSDFMEKIERRKIPEEQLHEYLEKNFLFKSTPSR